MKTLALAFLLIFAPLSIATIATSQTLDGASVFW